MSETLLWIGASAPPDAVDSLAQRRGWSLRSADPGTGSSAATRYRPGAVVVGTDDADLDGLRAATPAPIAYCPPATTADGVGAASAAGVDVVLPQDTDEWGVDTLLDRLATVESGSHSIADGRGSNHDTAREAAGDPPAPTGTATPTDERPPRGTLTVDEEGRISYVGERAAELLGRDAESLLASDLHEALPWADLGRLEGMDDLDADDGTVSTVERLMPANRWLELAARPTDAGATITVVELDAAERRRVVLDRLHGTTRRLFAAETPDAIAEIACEAARDVLGLEVVVVRLSDRGNDGLRVAAKTDPVDELMPTRSRYGVGESIAGAVYEEGSSRISLDLDEAQFGEVNSTISLPLGDHGVMSVGSTAPDAFDEADVSLARLLSTTVTAALDRAERETQLRRREAVLESVQGMVFVLDEDRLIDYVSTPLAERLGMNREEIVGKHVVEFVDVTEFYGAESRLREGVSELSLDLRIDSPDGESFPARVDLSVLEHTDRGRTLVGIVEDRSTLAETREDLRREHERLWTLFENLPDPVVDAEHAEGGPVIRAANDAFADVFGVDREAIVGQPIDEVLSLPAGERARDTPPEAINERVREGEVTGAKVRRETAHGARTFLFRGIPYAENGSVRAFGIYTDVTEIERRERHVKVLDRLLRHNLRNDLGVVIGRAENVLDRADDPDIESEAAALVEAANGLIDLSDTAKRIRQIIESPETERSTIDVANLFGTVAAGAREQFPGATVRVEDDLDDLAVLATSDLRLALEELVENAIVHGADSPTVDLRAETFEPAPEEWIDLLVVDNGPGIPEAERAAVTGSRDITQLQHGSGLGLWLVRWAVESVGGDVSFERRDGNTVVRLRLRRMTE
ncbi:PAS domain-containing protein [Halolamina sp. C58]|uniref:PAS domain-containing protein n=1 Tax=Halolamina sp. C58 TaxID=3421640 RepID=UPI003EB94CDE